jgi:membrane-bound lytic murein transglycosylase B
MKRFKQISILLIFCAVALLVTPMQFTWADPADSTTQQTQDQLQQQLQAIEQEIAQYEQQLNGVQSQKNTLAKKIKVLQIQKSKVQAQISETNINIKNIGEQISATETQIVDATEHINSLRGQVANLIPDIYDKDQQSTIEMLLGNDGLIGFYNELDAYEEVNKNLQTLLNQLDDQSKQLKLQQDQLTNQQQQQKDFLSIQSIQSSQLATNISDQNQLLDQTKGIEANYQATLKDKKTQAAAIQNRLYELFGVGSSQQVTFGQAVAIAKYASGQTGVRAAFLLAILTQESNLGKNVGTCNRASDPPSKSYKAVMNPTRDIPPFLQVTSDLGLDPATTPVSCPMHDSRGRQIGWGGAMGPAQFIPSTWMGYKDQVAALTGKPANPWDIRDAFLAAAIKLKAAGADNQANEWKAAMVYFSGGTNLKFRFYGDNVVATANRYQSDIDELNGQ